ncbi:MAG: hypothetical protein HY644_03730 [Acidobacteria bacterium]|nr:hypothetical protein [Acidobacteriota bacterium]
MLWKRPSWQDRNPFPVAPIQSQGVGALRVVGPTAVMEAELSAELDARVAQKITTQTQEEPYSGNTAETLYREAQGFVMASLQRAEVGEPMDVKQGLEIVRRMVDSVTKDNGLILLATNRMSEFSLPQSSVNVSIVAARIGCTLAMKEDRIARLTLAGLFHRIGSVKLPTNLLDKPDSFSSAEQALVKRVPDYSAQLVSRIPGFEWLPQIIAKIYEGGDRPSPPRSSMERDLREEADVVGISIVFDACIHRRPHREAVTGHETLEQMIHATPHFPDHIVKAMIRTLSVYPFNEFVILNTGEIGQVIDIHSQNPVRPVVKVFSTVDQKPFYKTRIVDLVQHFSIYIKRAITWRELPGGCATNLWA